MKTSRMRVLTVESVLAAADAAVAERGEGYRYPRKWKVRPSGWRLWERWRKVQCQYVRPDNAGPACLIGEILHRNGVPLEELALREDRDAPEVIAALFPDTSSEVTYWLSNAQVRQDDRERWGSIVGDLHEVLA